MSPKKLTRSAIYTGLISLGGAGVMGLWQLDIGMLVWWPVVGLLFSFGLIGAALFKGWMLSVQERVAMSDAINLCYIGEGKSEDGQTHIVHNLSDQK